jgi:DNA-binding MarR family transcriptional regulator
MSTVGANPERRVIIQDGMSPSLRSRKPTRTPGPLLRGFQTCRPETSACVLRHVSRTSRAVVAVFDEALKPAGLTGNQFNLLMSLAQDGPMTVNTLARHIGVDSSTVPRAVAPLKRDRLVAVDVGTDRRQRVIAITAAGCRRLAIALPRWEAVQQSILKSVGHTAWDSLIADLRKVRRALTKAGERGAAL